MEKKILFVDLDGTLLTDSKEITPENLEAIQEAKKGNFEEADNRLKECEEALNNAHNTQTEMIQSEIRGDHIPVMLLMVHAQDHLMDAMVVKDMAVEFVELYRTMAPQK